jgi:hypothetical protein
MMPISQAQLTFNFPSIADDDVDGRDRAARLLASRFALPLHVAQLVCRLSGLGPREAAS